METYKIESLDHEGRGIARRDGKTIFIEDPADIGRDALAGGAHGRAHESGEPIESIGCCLYVVADHTLKQPEPSGLQTKKPQRAPVT